MLPMMGNDAGLGMSKRSPAKSAIVIAPFRAIGCLLSTKAPNSCRSMRKNDMSLGTASVITIVIPKSISPLSTAWTTSSGSMGYMPSLTPGAFTLKTLQASATERGGAATINPMSSFDINETLISFTASIASSYAEMTSLIFEANTFPALVSRTEWLSRTNRRAPTSFSRELTCLLSVDCAICKCRADAE